MRISQIIIYTATDFSMYKVRKSKLNLTGVCFVFEEQLQTVRVNWPKRNGVIWHKIRFFNSAWKLSTNKDRSPTEYSCWQKYSNPVASFSEHFFSFPTSFKFSFKKYFKLQKMSGVTLLVTVYSKYLEQISVHVLTDIHHSRKQGKSVPLKAGKKKQQKKTKPRREG